MSYNDIIEGLKCCTVTNFYVLCSSCPYQKKDSEETDCSNILMQDALSLIEQQSAIIAQLQKI